MRAPSTFANSSSIFGEAEDGISSVRCEFTEFFRACTDNFSRHATFSLNDIASVASVNGELRLPDFSRRASPLPTQKFAQNANSLVYVLLLQQEGRQEAYYGVVCAVEQHTLRQSLLYYRTAGNVQIDSLNESAAADFFGGGVVVD